jgi:hypothetical protein
MLALLSRVFGSVIIGVCLSAFGMLLALLFLFIRNLPKILQTLQRGLRGLLRASFRLYNAIMSPLRIWVYQKTGVDIHAPLIRTFITILLSLAIGVGVLIIFSLSIRPWILILLGVHGLFVGLAWESILYSDKFQLGVNLE